MSRPDYLTDADRRCRMIVAALCFAASAACSALLFAQTTTGFPPPGPAIDIVMPITATLPDGTSSTTTYTIKGDDAFRAMFQATQHEQNSWSIQNMRQYATPVCLVGTAADNASSFDWATSKLRVEGAIYSVNAAGVPYKNAIRLGSTTTVQRLCLFGTDVFVKGKADGKWYQWTAPEKWYALPAASIDSTVLN